MLATGTCQTTIQWMTSVVCDHQAAEDEDDSDQLIQPGLEEMCLIQTNDTLFNLWPIQKISG